MSAITVALGCFLELEGKTLAEDRHIPQLQHSEKSTWSLPATSFLSAGSYSLKGVLQSTQREERTFVPPRCKSCAAQ